MYILHLVLEMIEEGNLS